MYAAARIFYFPSFAVYILIRLYLDAGDLHQANHAIPVLKARGKIPWAPNLAQGAAGAFDFVTSI